MATSKKKNRCYSARYGGRYRNFSMPKKRASETWADYHDRLSGMAAIALERGHRTVAQALEKRAGEVAARFSTVRKKPRGRGASGPGTYPWSQCIKDARARGSRDPKAVCGAIRARSRKKYPEYWKARHTKKRNPTREGLARSAYCNMERSACSVAEALSTTGKRRGTWLVSAAMYAGAALGDAYMSGDRGLVREAKETADQVRHLTVESATWKASRSTKNPRGGKKTKKPTRKKNSRAIMRSFMSLR